VKVTGRPKESTIENGILNYLNLQKGSFFWKNPSSGYFNGKNMVKHKSKYAIRGVADILGIYLGKFIAFEVKSEIEFKFYEKHGDRLKTCPFIYCRSKKEENLWRQIHFIENLNAKGGIGNIVCSIDQVKKILQTVRTILNNT